MEIVAADTNVLIRFLVDDNPAEGRRARELFTRHTVYLSESVMLESEWVLRAVYGFSPTEIATAFHSLLRLPAVTFEDRQAIFQVISWFEEGFDFADALHYFRSSGFELKTFDKKFLNKGRRRHLKISAP